VTTFPPTVDLIVDGESVNAGIINRPLSQLANRTQSNKEKIDALRARGALITAPDVAVDDLVLDSQLVYWNAVTEKLERGIAELVPVGAPPIFEPTPRNFVLGIAQNIRGTPGNKICDLHLRGLVPSLNVANFLQTTETPLYGVPYHLTILPTELGRVTGEKPGLRVFAGILLESGELFLNPDLRSLGEDHGHFQFGLDPDIWVDMGPSVALTGALTFTLGSTTVTGVGTLFTTEIVPGNIIQLDADARWVRVDSIIDDFELILVRDYDGAGGAGASTLGVGPWLYPGINFDPFPPIPFQSSVLTVNGSVLKFDDEFTVDLDGLHYLDLAYPPSHNDFEACLFYVFPLGLTSPGVTQLKVGTPNVVIQNCSPGGPPDTGNLKVSVFPILVPVTALQSGGVALKSLVVDPVTGNLLTRFGPVVEKIVGGTGVSVSPPDGQGIVTVTSVALDEIREPIPEILLRNAKQAFKNVTPYTQFPEGVRAGFLGKIKLPDTLNLGVPLSIIFEMLGETGISISEEAASFALKYNVIDPASGENLAKATLTLSKTIDFPFPYIAFDTFVATIFEIPGSQLVPGATVSFELSRNDTTDSYNGTVGVLTALYRVKLV
jgi:hypothetical protein